MNRIAFFIYYERQGVVADYVTYYVKKLAEITSKTVFIVNGKISNDGLKKIRFIPNVVVYQRENRGLDFGAWKEAFLKESWNELERYDELILANCSSYGPLFPLKDVFKKMETSACDFWGMTKHPATGAEIIQGRPDSRINEHIQSYFLVFNEKVIKSELFQNWWNNLREYSDYAQEIAYHENQLTKYLIDGGFVSGTVADTEKYFSRNSPFNMTFCFAPELISSDHLPFIKRKIFTNDDYVWNRCGEGFGPQDVIDEIRKTDYPIEYIWDDVLREQKLSVLKDALALTFIPTSHKSEKQRSNHKVALVCYGYYPDLAGYMCGFIANMPDYADILILSSRQETLEVYKKEIAARNLVFGNVRFELKPNRGRDISSLLVAAAPFLQKYEAFCFIHDKKSKQVPYTFSRDFMRRCAVCCLDSKDYVKDLIDELFSDTRCGVLMPPIPYFADYFTPGAETFGKNAEILRGLFERLNLNIPFDEKAVAPFGTMFWAKTDALKDILTYPWKYEDFPDEPLGVDFTISHGIERVFAYCAQNRGFYSKWVMPPRFAGLYINNLSYRLRDYNCELYRIFGLHNWLDMLNTLKGFSLSPKITTTFRYGSYLRYKLLSKLFFGHRKEHYRKKYFALKAIKRERRIKFF